MILRTWPISLRALATVGRGERRRRNDALALVRVAQKKGKKRLRQMDEWRPKGEEKQKNSHVAVKISLQSLFSFLAVAIGEAKRVDEDERRMESTIVDDVTRVFLCARGHRHVKKKTSPLALLNVAA